jgi:general L-amino acid transport system substrate-binding protein
MAEVKSVTGLKDAKVCSTTNGKAEKYLYELLDNNSIPYKNVPFESDDQAIKGFEKDSCNVLVRLSSRLQGIRSVLAEPENAVILPEVLTKEPLGTVVRQGDDIWLTIVSWALYVMIDAEELGITSRNVEEMKISHVLEIRQLLGLDGKAGKTLGLNNDWAYQIIHEVGNYGEVFERNLGQKSPLKIERGLNNLWNKGGLLYAPPFR